MIKFALAWKKHASAMEGAKYRTLVEALKKNILDGRYGNGNPFPGVRALDFPAGAADGPRVDESAWAKGRKKMIYHLGKEK